MYLGGVPLKRKYNKIILIIIIMSLISLNCYAHSGRTDSSGGHKDNNNNSGLGSYHYHHGYGPHLHTNGTCPYSTSTVQIEEVDPEPVFKNVSSISLSMMNAKMTLGDDQIISKTIQPFDATNKSITWSSSNSDVIMVNTTGRISAIGYGSAIITATTHNNIIDSIEVEVKRVIEDIAIIENNLNLNLNDIIILSTDLDLEYFSSESLIWSSSNESVAKVNEFGQVVVISSGSTVITVTTTNGLNDQINVEIVPEEINKGNKVEKSNETSVIDIDQEVKNIEVPNLETKSSESFEELIEDNVSEEEKSSDSSPITTWLILAGVGFLVYRNIIGMKGRS